MRILKAYYNPVDKQFYRDSGFTKLMAPSPKYRYLDLNTTMTYVWDGQKYLDGAFYTDYSYTEYGD